MISYGIEKIQRYILARSERIAIKLIWNLQVPDYQDFPMDTVLHIGFTHHMVILRSEKKPMLMKRSWKMLLFIM